MSKTRGEGRAESEKRARMETTPEYRRRQQRRRRAEEKEWAEKSGPVTVRRKEDPAP